MEALVKPTYGEHILYRTDPYKILKLPKNTAIIYQDEIQNMIWIWSTTKYGNMTTRQDRWTSQKDAD